MYKIFNNTKCKFILAVFFIISFTFSNFIGFAEEITIKDLNEISDYAKPYILDLYSQGIIKGDEEGYFHPNRPISRIEMLALVVRILDLDTSNPPADPTFYDVPKDHWAFPYVETAYQSGIVNGVTENFFAANQTCTREEMTVMFIRSLGFTDVEIDTTNDINTINKLTDKDEISEWAKKYVTFAMTTELMNGTGNDTFSPKGQAIREQAAVLTFRFINYKENIIDHVNSDIEIPYEDIEKLAESIVLVETYDKNGALMAQGSGFAIDNGLFLTNYHVLQGSDNYKITTAAGDEYDIEGIVKYNEDVDLAIIKTKEPVNIKALNVEPMDMLNTKTYVAAIGNPQGKQGVITVGIINELKKIEYGENGSLDVIEFTAPVSPGSSGGALVNMESMVIGITSAMSDSGNLFYAVSIAHAIDWIEELQSMTFEEITVIDMTEEIEKYLDVSDEGIKDLIIKAITALEEEDIEKYLSTIHTFSSGFKEIRPLYEELFQIYDFDYEIQEIEIIEKHYNEATVEVVYTIEKLSGPEFEDLTILGQYYLVKQHGKWKVYYAQESLIENLE